MPSFQKDITIELTANGEGESAKLSVRGATDVGLEYTLCDTAGNRYRTTPEQFPLSDVTVSATSDTAIKAHILSVFGATATTEQVTALSALVILRQRIDIRTHAAGLAGFTLV